jgi:hypothetical protein
MKLTISEGGIARCDRPICGSCRVNEHDIDDCLPGDTLFDHEGHELCIGCGHVNEAGGVHEFCRPAIVARIATRFGGIDGEHHKQWVIDQMLRACLQDKYDDWVDRMNEDTDYDPWDVGIAP